MLGLRASVRALGWIALTLPLAAPGCGSRRQRLREARAGPRRRPGLRVGAAPTRGLIVWHELVTSDPDAASAFYRAVVGWQTSTDEKGYTLCSTSAGPLAGIARLTPDMAAKKVTPFWVPSVDVADVDDAADSSRGTSGGSVYVEPVDLPTFRFSCLGDPRGPAINVMHPFLPLNPHLTVTPGEFAWNGLQTADADSALTFYSRLFGWVGRKPSVDPGGGSYTVCARGPGADDLPTAAIHAGRELALGWLSFIQVASLDVALTAAKGLGARVLAGPMPVPSGRIVTLTDPQGALIALREGSVP